jgi:hypothetical protein
VNKAAVFIVLLLLPALAGCTGELNIGDFKHACEKDSDCGEGFKCDPAAGCVAIQPGADGGQDAGPVSDGGIFLRHSSTYDSAAGVCLSPAKDLTLKSATGWSTGPRSGGPPALQAGQPWGRK